MSQGLVFIHLSCGGDFRRCTDSLHGKHVDSEGVLRVNSLQTFVQEGFGKQDKDIVRTISERDTCRIDIMTFRQCHLQIEAVAIGVAGEFRQCPVNDFQRPCAGSEWILVRCELDDVADAVFALKLRDRLARLIGFQPLDGRNGPLQKGDVHTRSSGISDRPPTRAV